MREVEFVYACHRRPVQKSSVAEFAVAVLRTEDEAQGMFRIGRIATEPTANAYSGIGLKARLAVRSKQFQRNRTLPFNAVLLGLA